MGYLLKTDDSINAAIKWLDEARPDWIWSVDLGTLDIADPRNCVLGQVFADLVPEGSNSTGFNIVWTDGYNGSRISMDTMAFGIIPADISDEYDGDDYDPDYDYDGGEPEHTSEDLYAELNEDWCAAITALREARK